MLYPLAKRFIAGHNFDSAKPSIKKLLDSGYEVSIDYLGELSQTLESCESAKKQYIEIINFYRNQKVDISIKPSQLGLHINPVISFSNIKFLAKLAKMRGHTIRLDMENSEVTEATRNLAISLNRRYGNVGVAIQANLHRTKEDLVELIREGVSVRLVKGAYRESASISLREERDIESSFFQLACTLNSAFPAYEIRPAIATHDEALLGDVLEMIPNPDRSDYEFLYGIRRDIQRKMRNDGFKVRIYVPFGEDWLPYVLRRLREWKNLKFIVKNIFYEMFKLEK